MYMMNAKLKEDKMQINNAKLLIHNMPKLWLLKKRLKNL